MDTVSLAYLPIAVGLGALHALEPGHAKTMTAAYLIGIGGRWRDAVVLGLAAAITHSIVVIGLAVIAVALGRAAFTGEAIRALTIGSGVLVILLGAWMLWRRLRARSAHHHGRHDDHDHDHDRAADDGHHHALPTYVGSGQRPSLGQVLLFGAAGGLIPCPASVSVMLLALSIGSTVSGVVLVAGFSIGLAAALVAVGLLVVLGVRRFLDAGRFPGLMRAAPLLSAGVIILSGIAALVLAFALPHAVS